MQPAAATFDSFRQTPGNGMAKGTWGQSAAYAGSAGDLGLHPSRPRRKKTLLGLTIMAGVSTMSWVAVFAWAGLI